MNDKNVVIKDARTLGVPKMLLLGLQHMFAMFGATILVPILVNNYFEGEGLSTQVTLICSSPMVRSPAPASVKISAVRASSKSAAVKVKSIIPPA